MTQTPRPVDDGRLDTVRESIDEARAAEADLHERDVLGDVGEEPGSGRTPSGPDDGHGTFEPSGDDRQAGENPSEGPDAATPGEAGDDSGRTTEDGEGDGPRPEHRAEPESVEQFDGPGPNPL